MRSLYGQGRHNSCEIWYYVSRIILLVNQPTDLDSELTWPGLRPIALHLLLSLLCVAHRLFSDYRSLWAWNCIRRSHKLAVFHPGYIVDSQTCCVGALCDADRTMKCYTASRVLTVMIDVGGRRWCWHAIAMHKSKPADDAWQWQVTLQSRLCLCPVWSRSCLQIVKFISILSYRRYICEALSCVAIRSRVLQCSI